MFDLTITFTGICLLVPDSTRQVLHVLMPKTPADHPHYPRLIFVDEAGDVQKKDIAGMDLELVGVSGGNGFAASVHPEIFDFGDTLLGPRKVKQVLLDPDKPKPEALISRALLTAGKFGNRRRGGHWKFEVGAGFKVRRLPTAMDWHIEDVGLSFLTVKDKLGGGSFKVYPKNGEIHLLIVHVTKKELDVIGPNIPPNADCPADGDDAQHLELYSPILDPVVSSTILPKFDRATTYAAGLCATPTRATRVMSRAEADTATCVAAAAAAAALATAPNGDSPARVAAVAAAAAAAVATSTAAAAAAGGSELTCMVATAPPE